MHASKENIGRKTVAVAVRGVHLLAAVLGIVVLSSFVRVQGTQFRQGYADTPYYYIGVNMWYGPCLAALAGDSGCIRLCAELDSLRVRGVTNVRVFAPIGATWQAVCAGRENHEAAPLMAEEKALRGLDFFLAEMAKRQMLAVICLQPAAAWVQGDAYHRPAAVQVASSAACTSPIDALPDSAACSAYRRTVMQLLTRTNTCTGRPYAADSTIMAWQLFDEPHPASLQGASAFMEWMRETAALVKRLAPRQLLSVGMEGMQGLRGCEQLYADVHMLDDVDYLTLHLWPERQRWTSSDRLFDALPRVYRSADDCLAEHQRLAQQLGKPLVVEAFAYPRDHVFLSPRTETLARAYFFDYVMQHLRESRAAEEPLAGVNVWGWAGFGCPAEGTWHAGADFVAEPPAAVQGRYSIYVDDAAFPRF